MPKASTTFQVVCPQCNRVIVANDSQVGTRITCTDCLEEFTVVRPPQSDSPKVEEHFEPESLFGETPPADGNHSEDIWEDDRRQLDALLKFQEGPTPAADSGPYDFTSACPLCGTRMDLSSEQIGATVRCPDCHSNFKVREPSKKARRSQHESTTSKDDDFKLSDLPPDPPHRSRPSSRSEFPAADEVVKADRSPASKPAARVLTPEEISRDMLARAEREIVEQNSPVTTLPPTSLTGGIAKFLLQPAVISRVFFLAIGLWIEMGAISSALGLTTGGPIQQFGSVVLRPIALVFGLLLLANLATSWLAVLQDTAGGRDELETMPGANPTEWFFESWPVFASLFLVGVFPGILAQATYYSSNSAVTAFLFGAIPGGILLVTAFPVIVTSFMENSTPFSPAVWRGLQLSLQHWIGFMIQASVLVAAELGLFLIRIISTSAILNLLVCIGLIALPMVYFRLLGRLTYICQQNLAKQQMKEDEEEQS